MKKTPINALTFLPKNEKMKIKLRKKAETLVKTLKQLKTKVDPDLELKV